MYGIEVVLTDEDERQPFQGGEVQALRENALVHSPIPEETSNHSFAALQAHRVRITHRVRDRRTNHSRGTHESGGSIHQVHGPAFPLGAPRDFAVEFSEHLLPDPMLGPVQSVASKG